MKLSVSILTYNEEENIEECLKSVAFADEIVLVDEKSSDNTVKIAKKYNAKVILVDHYDKNSKPLIGGNSSGHDTMFHRHKQESLDNCQGEWIFQIDADERVSPELKEEILRVIKTDDLGYNGYFVPRRNMIFNKWIEHSGWYPDYQVKLIRNKKGRYPCKTVHELIEVDGQIGTLKNDLIHYHYKSVSQFIDRLNRYTTNDAQYILNKGESVEWSDAILFPTSEFLKRFFLWEGYKDGIHGFSLSLLQALSRFVVFLKIWEINGFKEKELKLSEFDNLAKQVAKDYRYWRYTAALSETKNLLNRLRIKVLRKLR